MRVAQRIERLPRQFFAQLVQATAALQAAGHDVINLGQGNPDLPTPGHIVRVLQETAADPSLHRYIPFTGLPEFKRAVAAWYARRFGVQLDPERHVAVLIGSKLGLQELSLCLLEPGDVALVPDPGYPDYLSGIALAGARAVGMPLTEDSHFMPEFSGLPQAARLMLLNFPGNPTGRVAAPGVFEAAVRYAGRTGAVIAHDLAYADIVYDGRTPVSFLQTPGALDVGVELGTLSKSYNMAGWRLGWAVGRADLIAALEVLQDHLNCSQFGAIQRAGAAALTGPDEPVTALRRLYQERRDVWLAACAAIGWPMPASEGSFYVWGRVPSGWTSGAFAQALLERAHVVVAPGSGFGTYGEGYVRISLTAPAERLRIAAERIGGLGLF